MVGATAQAHGVQFSLGPLKRIPGPGEFERRCDVFEGRHCWNEMKGLENDAHVVAPKTGQCVLVHRRQVLTQDLDRATGCLFQPTHDHQE